MSKASDRVEMFHLKMFGFEQFLKPCKIRSKDKVEYTSESMLLCQIQLQVFENYNLSWGYSHARLAFERFRDLEEHCIAIQEDTHFVMCSIMTFNAFASFRFARLLQFYSVYYAGLS